MSKEMLISTTAEQECRIAIVDDGRLEELYVERASSASHVGNIYKGRITNVESAIQAAFVDFGLRKNGFLHISDVHPKYFPGNGKTAASEVVGRKFSHRDRPPIQECLRRGQEVIVQMTKEGIGTKGPTMTTYLSIPGRLLVMMPGMSRLGVSRKVEDEEARQRAKAILNELKVPQDIGFIVRTAGIDRSKREVSRDLNYLLRLWKTVSKEVKRCPTPSEIYRESDLVTRTIRDVYNSDIQRVVCDSPEVARKAKESLTVVVPRTPHSVELYTGGGGLFHDYGLEEEIERVYSRRVELRSGGSLVFDQTEALVAIDVNSGRFRQHTDAETTAMKLNLEAAGEIARQLRLRDLGGVVVIDFVDMRQEKNRRAVERALREAIKADRAKTKILRISALGLVEMTRQRIGPSLKSSIYRTCSECDGMGLIKSEESQSLLIMRSLQRASQGESVSRVDVRVTPSVAHHVSNHQRQQIAELEARMGKRIVIQADDDLHGDEMEIVATNARGSTVAWEREQSGGKRTGKLETVNVDDLPPELGQPAPKPSLYAAPEDSTPEAGEESVSREDVASPSDEAPPKKSRRRGRRGGRKHKRSTPAASPVDGAEPSSEATPQETPHDTQEATEDATSSEASDSPTEQPAEKTPAKRSRRRGSRNRKRAETTTDPGDSQPAVDHAADGATVDAPHDTQEATEDATSSEASGSPTEQSSEKTPAKRSRRRGSRSRKRAETTDQKDAKPAEESAKADAPHDAQEATVDEPSAEVPDTADGGPEQPPEKIQAKRSRRRGPRKRKHPETTDQDTKPAEGSAKVEAPHDTQKAKADEAPRETSDSGTEPEPTPQPAAADDAEATPKRRRRSRRKKPSQEESAE